VNTQRIELEGSKDEFTEFLKHMKLFTHDIMKEWESIFIQLEEKITKLPDMEGLTHLDIFFKTTYPSTIPPSEETKHKVFIQNTPTFANQVVDSRSLQDLQSDHIKWLEKNKKCMKFPRSPIDPLKDAMVKSANAITFGEDENG